MKQLYYITKNEAGVLLKNTKDKEFLDIYGCKLYVSFLDYPLINPEMYDHYNGGTGTVKYIIEKIIKEQHYNS